MSSSIDALTQATAATTGTSSVNSTKDAVMGKQDFLTLLVAQLQNQDPLNPDNPTEFTAQLAQFSSLEQLFSLNDSMEDLVSANADSDRFSTLSTIGKDVTYYSTGFNYSGSPVEIGYQLDGEASEVTLSLQQNGTTVATINGEDLDSGNHFVTWDGLLANNQKAPLGSYTIVLQAKSATDDSIAAAPLIKSEVTGVDLGAEDGTVLITKTGEIAFKSILGVYDSQEQTTTTTASGG